MNVFLRILEVLLITSVLVYSLYKLYRDENIEENRRDLFIIRGTIWRLFILGIMIYNFYNGKFTTSVVWNFFMNTSSEKGTGEFGTTNKTFENALNIEIHESNTIYSNFHNSYKKNG